MIVLSARDRAVQLRKFAGAPLKFTNYRGYMVEMLRSLARRLDFEYEFLFQKDQEWGSVPEAGDTWKGEKRLH